MSSLDRHRVPVTQRPRSFLSLRGMLLGVVCVGLGASASAQPPARAARRTPPVIGTVETLQGQTLKVNTTEHGEVSVTVPADARIVVQGPGTLADVKSGEFIGTTAVQGPDGKLRATEIHVFPEVMRGAGEGHFPMGAPATTMTNGNIEAVTGDVAQSAGAAGGGEHLSISYKGGPSQVQVEVPTTVSVTVIRVADAAALQPGANVTVLLAPRRTPGEGGITAATVIVHETAAH